MNNLKYSSLRLKKIFNKARYSEYASFCFFERIVNRSRENERVEELKVKVNNSGFGSFDVLVPFCPDLQDLYYPWGSNPPYSLLEKEISTSFGFSLSCDNEKNQVQIYAAFINPHFFKFLQTRLDLRKDPIQKLPDYCSCLLSPYHMGPVTKTWCKILST